MSKVILKQSQNRPMILLLLSLAMFMVILDSAIINVALPAMKAALHFDTSSLQWVLTAYILTFGGFLMLGAYCRSVWAAAPASARHRRIFTVLVASGSDQFERSAHRVARSAGIGRRIHGPCCSLYPAHDV